MALRFYKAYLSVLFAGQCRFVPTCSQYSYEAVERSGLARGSWLTLKRLLRCHPFQGNLGMTRCRIAAVMMLTASTAQDIGMR